MNWHLRFIARYSRKSRWNWRDEKTVFELRRYVRWMICYHNRD
jgi:hypothetical protein